jgi:hypothetical protein
VPVAGLVQPKVVRSPDGELVVQAVQPEGCRVCDGTEVLVQWGAHTGDVLPWTPRDARARLTTRAATHGHFPPRPATLAPAAASDSRRPAGASGKPPSSFESAGEGGTLSASTRNDHATPSAAAMSGFRPAVA